MPKVNLTNYAEREQAYIKHCLLEEYLPDWAYKVGSKWDELVYIDGFAGPWQTTNIDYADASFGVAIQALRQCQAGLRVRGRHLKIESILVDQDKKAFDELKKFAELQRDPDFAVYALHGQFVDMIGPIENLIKDNNQNAFRFIFLDPKGWADIPMKELRPFLRSRSCEVLINLMTRHIIRFLDEPDRAQSYNNLFGRGRVLETLRSSVKRNEPSHARAEHAVREYGLSLRLLCGFKYVSSAVILEPDKESIRYFLVYATNHSKGIEVFKNAEMKAARIQDEVRYDKRVRKTQQPDLLFGDAPPSSRISSQLRQFYSEKARTRMLQVLSSMRPGSKVHYSTLFCEAMAFPLVTPDDLFGWLSNLEPSIKLDLEGSSRRQKFLPLKEDWILVIDPKSLR